VVFGFNPASPRCLYARRDNLVRDRKAVSRDNSPLSERIAYIFAITVLLVTERILVVFVKEAKAL